MPLIKPAVVSVFGGIWTYNFANRSLGPVELLTENLREIWADSTAFAADITLTKQALIPVANEISV